MTGGLHEMQIDDVAPMLPKAIESTSPVTKSFDLWISALGFEERCGAWAQALAEGGSDLGVALVCAYTTNREQNGANETALIADLKRCSARVEWIEADEQNLTEMIRERIECLRARLDRPLRIGWDISVASNRLIVRLGRSLMDRGNSVEVLYSEAMTYFPTEEEYSADPSRWTDDERMGLDRGTLNVRTASEFPGVHSSQLPNRLIMLPGYNRDRVRKVISNVDSQFLVELDSAPIAWLVGSPHLQEDSWREAAISQIHGIPPTHESLPLSTFDYAETLSVLERLYGKWGRKCNLTISPMGSKFQALGCALFCIARPDVRVVFAQPEEYNVARYTSGVKARWSVDFMLIDSLLGELMKLGTLGRLAA
jgi:hypothetical protein